MEHDDFGVCPFVTAQRLLQGKWAIILLHQLYDGTKRFGELERATGITHGNPCFSVKGPGKGRSYYASCLCRGPAPSGVHSHGYGPPFWPRA